VSSDFWSNVGFISGTGTSGARFTQRMHAIPILGWHMNNTNQSNKLVTGCIRSETLDRLNVNDAG
jgi:hypothetical protein